MAHDSDADEYTKKKESEILLRSENEKSWQSEIFSLLSLLACLFGLFEPTTVNSYWRGDLRRCTFHTFTFVLSFNSIVLRQIQKEKLFMLVFMLLSDVSGFFL